MDCEVELQGGDLHAGVVTETNPVGFGIMDDAETLAVAEREMWLNSDQDDLLGVNDTSMFYADFPPLPDFPCMSSSSSSSSTPALPVNNITYSTTTSSSSSSSSASSSSAASWAVLRSDVDIEEDAEKNNINIINNNNYNSYMQQNNDPLDATTTPAALSSTASMEISQQHLDPGLGANTVGDCMDDVMDTFGYMELLESNDFFDPSSIFQSEENPLPEFTQLPQLDEHAMGIHHRESTQQQGEEEDHHHNHHQLLVCNNNGEEIQGEEGAGAGAGAGAGDEMSMVFLEWLKSNKDSVSANDLRSVKLKKATIESAARRLGGGKEAMKQLLKLILEWVQTSHLQNKRRKENNNNNNNINSQSNLLPQFQDPSQNQNTNTSSFAPESNACFNQTTPWLSSPQPFGTDQAPLMVSQMPFSQPMVGYVGDPYTNGATSNNMNSGGGTQTQNNNPYQTSPEYHMLESANSWPPSQLNVSSHYNQSFGDNNLQGLPPSAFGSYGNQYPYQFFHGPGDRLMRLGPSATKEARKKRMARQRRLLSHHRHNNHHQNHASDPHARLGSDNCTTVVAASHANPANWMYWQTMAGGAASLAPVVPVEQLPAAGQQVVDRSAMQTQNYHQGRVASERRQGWKPEKNLRFLLQKVLKQSDVGSLGRIVLPKKEAETHLPELEARDGISISMEDIGTSRIWNMRYRYWPNNKSRMYLLENTGDFVRANGLQEGDFIVIYSDVKCGKFMIRGVKVRQQGAKPETKKAGKSQKNQHGNNAATTAGAGANNGTPSSPKQKNEKAVN
ncbi:B3 domain-containing transcription factor ABI3 [Gastrolobium bilobum]|uniref:B3 domain-containing transcription factor ABI3 n=1 Tax=Gastrolobium bilobum TaxID=150636 RepID=UPI002AB1F018|nr:B3 domain-containing transcription factor ABI3 [Gastrolobium bilobum]